MAMLIPTMIQAAGTFSTWMATSGVGAALTAGSAAIGTVGAIQQGNAAMKSARYQNALAEKRADEERATASKKTAEMVRRGKLVASRARAVGAASGGGVDVDLAGDLEEETQRNALNAIWEGENRAQDLEQQGAEALYEGKNKKRASVIQAGTTLLSGAAGMSRYAPAAPVT